MNMRVKELVVAAGIYDCVPNDPDLEVASEYTDLVKATMEECISSIRAYDASGHFEQTIRKHFGALK